MSSTVERRRGRTLVDTSVFYDYGPALSHNAVYHFIVGGRGIGKTFGAKKIVIKNYLKDGAQFIYLRRYQTELKTRDTFFADIAHLFPEYGFRVNGSQAEITRNPHDDKPTWETMGYFVALSTAQSRKSVAYPDVTFIIFDEFIIEKGNIQYLPDEATVFNNFFSTVDRMQDKTRVLFLANSVSIMNPYFLEYGIKVGTERDGFIKSHGGFLVAHFPNSEEYVNAIRETRFGKFIEGTAYADYSMGNQFLDNHHKMIAKKPASATYVLTLLTMEGDFSVWSHMTDLVTTFHCQQKRPKEEIIFTTELGWVDESTTYLPFGDKLAGTLRTAFRHGRMTFDQPATRNAMLQLFKR